MKRAGGCEKQAYLKRRAEVDFAPGSNAFRGNIRAGNIRAANFPRNMFPRFARALKQCFFFYTCTSKFNFNIQHF